MYDRVLNLACRAHELKERWFRPGLYSRLWICDVKLHERGQINFRWIYVWMDVGMCNEYTNKVDIMPVEGGMYLVNGKTVCDPDGLERACFEGVWAECERASLAELDVLQEPWGYLRCCRLAGA